MPGKNGMDPEIFFVGSFDDSFYTLSFDPDRGEMTLLSETPSYPHPDVFTMDADRRVLYVGNEHQTGKGGVCAYDVKDPVHPRLLSWFPSRTEGPCHVGLVGSGASRHLVTSGYFDGKLHAYSLNEDGSIRGMTDELQMEGHGAYFHPTYISRQDHSRMHCVVPIPGTPWFASADLGGDAIYVFQLDHGKLRVVNSRKMRTASGPRHIVCRGDGRIWYVVDEMDCYVSALRFDPSDASLEVCCRVCALPDSVTQDSYCSALHLSPDERFLFVGNRGYDSIAILRVEEDGSRLSSQGWFREEISEPREFCFDRTGEYMLIGGMNTHCVTLNRYNKSTGELSFLDKLTGIRRPTCFVGI